MTAPTGLVMIAEDDPINAELLQDLLESQGWKVELAEDGEVALTKMAAGHYDLLLLDLHMPKVDGVDVLRRIQRGDVDRPGRIVVVTADLLYGIREDIVSLGAHALLSKPIDIAALFKIIALTEAEPAAAEALGGEANGFNRPLQ